MFLSLTDVHGLWDVIAILLIVMGPIVGGAVPLVLKQRAHNRAVTKTLGAVRDNVQNGNPTPMREDIDLMMTKIDHVIATQREQGKDISAQRKDIAGIREEIRTERLERIEGDKR